MFFSFLLLFLPINQDELLLYMKMLKPTNTRGYYGMSSNMVLGSSLHFNCFIDSLITQRKSLDISTMYGLHDISVLANCDDLLFASSPLKQLQIILHSGSLSANEWNITFNVNKWFYPQCRFKIVQRQSNVLLLLPNDKKTQSYRRNQIPWNAIYWIKRFQQTSLSKIHNCTEVFPQPCKVSSETKWYWP
jgi:hypothetical protein